MTVQDGRCRKTAEDALDEVLGCLAVRLISHPCLAVDECSVPAAAALAEVGKPTIAPPVNLEPAAQVLCGGCQIVRVVEGRPRLAGGAGAGRGGERVERGVTDATCEVQHGEGAHGLEMQPSFDHPGGRMRKAGQPGGEAVDAGDEQGGGVASGEVGDVGEDSLTARGRIGKRGSRHPGWSGEDHEPRPRRAGERGAHPGDRGPGADDPGLRFPAHASRLPTGRRAR